MALEFGRLFLFRFLGGLLLIAEAEAEAEAVLAFGSKQSPTKLEPPLTPFFALSLRNFALRNPPSLLFSRQRSCFSLSSISRSLVK
jgi:hypothetical protein